MADGPEQWMERLEDVGNAGPEYSLAGSVHGGAERGRAAGSLCGRYRRERVADLANGAERRLEPLGEIGQAHARSSALRPGERGTESRRPPGAIRDGRRRRVLARV